MEMRAHKGGNQEDIRWLTTDRDHAIGFGEVATYEVRASDVGHYDADEMELPAGGGWAADEAMKEIVRADGHSLAVIEGWEGDGLVLWIAKSRWVALERSDA